MRPLIHTVLLFSILLGAVVPSIAVRRKAFKASKSTRILLSNKADKHKSSTLSATAIPGVEPTNVPSTTPSDAPRDDSSDDSSTGRSMASGLNGEAKVESESLAIASSSVPTSVPSSVPTSVPISKNELNLFTEAVEIDESQSDDSAIYRNTAIASLAGSCTIVMLIFLFLRQQAKKMGSMINDDDNESSFRNSLEEIFGGGEYGKIWRSSVKRPSSFNMVNMAEGSTQKMFSEHGMVIQSYGDEESLDTNDDDYDDRQCNIENGGHIHEEVLCQDLELIRVNLDPTLEVDGCITLLDRSSTIMGALDFDGSSDNGTNLANTTTMNDTINILPTLCIPSGPSDEEEGDEVVEFEQLAEKRFPIPLWKPPIVESNIGKGVANVETTCDLMNVDIKNEYSLSPSPELEVTTKNTTCFISTPDCNTLNRNFSQSINGNSNGDNDGGTVDSVYSAKRRLFLSVEEEKTAPLVTTNNHNEGDDVSNWKKDSEAIQQGEIWI